MGKKIKKQYRVWDCKIGVRGDLDLPPGADAPMRRAIEEAFFNLTGRRDDFCFSGWGGKLTPVEQEVFEIYQQPKNDK